MITIKIWNNNKEWILDINEDTTLDITYAIADVRDIASVKSPYSRTIVFPDTRNNYLAFGSIGDIAFETNTYDEPYFSINSRTKCSIAVDTIEVFNGYLQLVSVEYNSNGSLNYNCNIFDSVMTFADRINGKFLTDIDFSAINHNWTMDNIEASWNTAYNLGYFYPLIDYNMNLDYNMVNGLTSRLSVNNFVPSISVKYILDQIFGGASMSYRSNFLNTDAFTSLVMPNLNKTISYGTTYSDDKKFKVSMSLTHSSMENNRDNGLGTASSTLNGYPNGSVNMFPNPGPWPSTIGTSSADYQYSKLVGQIIDASQEGFWVGSGVWVGGDRWNKAKNLSPMASLESYERQGIRLRFDDETTNVWNNNYDGNNLWNNVYDPSSLGNPNDYTYTNTSNDVLNERFVVNLDMYSIYHVNSSLYNSNWEPDVFEIIFYRSINPMTGVTDSTWQYGLGFPIPNNNINNTLVFYGDGSADTENGSISIYEFDSPYAYRFQNTNGLSGMKSCMVTIKCWTDFLDGRYDIYNRYKAIQPGEKIRVVFRWKPQHAGFLLTNGAPGLPNNSNSYVTNKLAILGGTMSTNILQYKDTDTADNFMDSVALKTITSPGLSSVEATNTFIYTNHGFTNGTKVFFNFLTGCAGLSAGVNYFIINATINTFQLSFTSGGSAIDFVSELLAGSLRTREAIYKPQTGLWNEISNSISPGNKIDFKNIVPAIKQTDFIDSITKMFNLCFEPDKEFVDVINIETRNTYVNSGNIKDWTDRVDLKEVVTRQLLAETQNKNTIFTYDDDSDILNKNYKTRFNNIYGNYNYEITKNEYLKGKKEIKINFAASPLTKLIPFNNQTTCNFIFTQFLKGETSTNTDDIKVNPRILYRNYLLLSDNLKIYIFNPNNNIGKYYSYLPYAGTYDNPYEPTLSLDFGTPYEVYFQPKYLTNRNLFNMYWKDYMDEISGINSFILTIKMLLTPVDIYNFRFCDIIYLDLSSLGMGNAQGYYRVNKISGYNPLSLGPCSVELIKADKYNVNTIGTYGGNLKTIQNSGYGWNSVLNAGGNFNNPSNQIAVNSNGSNQVSGAAVVMGYNNQINSNSVISGNSNQVSSSSIVSGNNNQIASNSNSNIVIGSNNKVFKNVNNSLVIGDGIDVKQSGAIITSSPMIEYINLIDAGDDNVLDAFSDGSLINLIDAGDDNILGFDRDIIINLIDADDED